VAWPHPHDAGGQRVARHLRAAEAAQQRGLPVQRQPIQVFRRDHPGQCRLAEQSLGNHLRRLGCQAQTAVAARAGVLHALVADHAHLLRHDVQLLADLHADLAQRRAVMRAHALVFGQLVASHLARQRRIQRLAASLGALVRRHGDLAVLGLGGCRLGRCAFELGLVEEQVLLLRADFALGFEELALEAVELLLEQVAFGAHHAQLADEFLATRNGVGQRLAQRGDLLEGRHVNHRRAFSSSRAPPHRRSAYRPVTMRTLGNQPIQ